MWALLLSRILLWTILISFTGFMMVVAVMTWKQYDAMVDTDTPTLGGVTVNQLNLIRWTCIVGSVCGIITMYFFGVYPAGARVVFDPYRAKVYHKKHFTGKLDQIINTTNPDHVNNFPGDSYVTLNPNFKGSPGTPSNEPLYFTGGVYKGPTPPSTFDQQYVKVSENFKYTPQTPVYHGGGF